MFTKWSRLTLALALVGCGAATEPRGGKTTIDEVDIVPSSVSMSVGESVQLSVLAFDKAGNAVTTKPTWTSSDARVASVSSSGFVTAAAIGTTAITATIGGVPGVAVVTVAPKALDITVDNQLIYPVNVSSGGVLLGTVGAQSTRQLTGPGLPAGAAVDWELVRPIVGNRPIGDPMAGTFAPTAATSGTRRLTITNLIGGDWYFAPVINNNTGTDLLMTVNYQLQSENRCNCIVSAGRTSVAIGYYKLFSNSNVTAFRGSSNYSGGYTYFNNFGVLITVGSGRREFTYTISP